jgi:hypothetical protein
LYSRVGFSLVPPVEFTRPGRFKVPDGTLSTVGFVGVIVPLFRVEITSFPTGFTTPTGVEVGLLLATGFVPIFTVPGIFVLVTTPPPEEEPRGPL